jgi:Na+-driven multidrug efflux pump
MISRFISIFLVPIYTKLLLPDDYGKLSLVNSTFYFVTALAVFAMDSASARWYYDTEDLNEKKSIFSSWFWFQFFTSLILCIVIILSSTLFSRIILKEPNQQLLFIIPAVGLISSILPTMISNWLRYQRKAIHTVIFTICNVLLNIGLNILFVVYLKMNVKGILYALLISNSIASIYVLIILKDC